MCLHNLRICKYLLQRDLWKTPRIALGFFSEATEFRVAECPDHATKVYKKRWHHQKHERIRLNNRLRHHIRHSSYARKNGFFKYSYGKKLRGNLAECNVYESQSPSDGLSHRWLISPCTTCSWINIVVDPGSTFQSTNQVWGTSLQFYVKFRLKTSVK